MTPSPRCRYSLWLVPEGAVEHALQAIIDRLAQAHSGPTFPPHVTLLGSIVTTEDDLLERSRRLAASVGPFTIELDGLDTDETYYQSLFATGRPTPEVLAVRDAAQQAFPEVAVSPYRPHLSLLYGHPPIETKRAIIEALRGTLPTAFEARILVAISTGPSASDWRHVLRAALSG